MFYRTNGTRRIRSNFWLGSLLSVSWIALVAASGCDSSESGGTGNGDGDGDLGGAGPMLGDEPCDSDDECDDGNPCNGEETCEPLADDSYCVDGASVACDAGKSCDRASGECLSEGCDSDGDGHDSVECGGDDCDDSDSNRFPGNSERCLDAEGKAIAAVAEHDEDCDPSTLGSDDDDDGFYEVTCANEDEDGELVFGEDCDDMNPLRNPFYDEICDGLDNDCVGGLDYPGEDDDGDGFADCEDLNDQVQFDCNDEDDTVYPGASEACDGVDSNCDGHREDEDDDGYSAVDEECSGGDHPKEDCDDTQSAASPGNDPSDEVCDNVDNDCSGTVDDGDATLNSCGATQTNGAPACFDGLCGVSCDEDYANCDGNLGSGCESHLPTALRHCGACGIVCAVECATSSCREEWVDQWGTAQADAVGGIYVDSAGNTLVAWYGGSESRLTRLDSTGNAVWTKAFLEGVAVGAPRVTVDAEGNAFGAGQTADSIIVGKIDENGDSSWVETFGVTDLAFLSGVGVDDAGNVFVVGTTSTQNFLSKVDATGSFVDTVTWSSDGFDTVGGLVVSGAGDVFVVGRTTGAFPSQSNLGGYDAYLSTFDSSLTLVSTIQFGTDADDDARAVARDASGSLYIAGQTNGNWDGVVGGGDAFLVKLSEAGGQQWVTQWGSTALDAPWSVAVDSSGRAVVVGSTQGDLDGRGAASSNDAFVTFFGESGGVTSSYQWGDQLNTSVDFVFSSPSGDAYLAGLTQGDMDGEGNANPAPLDLQSRQDAFALRLNR